MFVCVIPFWSFPLLMAASAMALLHVFVDSCKFLCARKTKHESILYYSDQIVHIASMIAISLVLLNAGYSIRVLPGVNRVLTTILKNPGAAFRWIGLILLAHKPINVTIKQLTIKFKPEKADEEGRNNAGAFIGTLERLIILILISINQYAAIGLVLTAKSVARFNKISEEKPFAEYYLLGTLLSTLAAIILYFIFT